MPTNPLFLDANILLEIILDRKYQSQAKKLLKANSPNLYISALTAHLVTHFGQPIVGLPILRRFLADYIVLSLGSEDFEWAFNNSLDGDFEDALQLAVAIRNGCSIFSTLDKDLVKTYQNLPTIQVQLLDH